MSTSTVFSELSYPTILTAGAEEEIERARVHGHAAGYAAGLRAAEAEAAIHAERARQEREALRGDAATALAAALAALEAAALRVSESASLVLAEADASLTSAAIELAESILGRELASDASSAKAAIARVFSVVDEQPVLDVRLSPVDLAVITANDLFPARVQLIGDPSLDRGDAIVDVPSGRVDARISSALERARAEIGVVR